MAGVDALPTVSKLQDPDASKLLIKKLTTTAQLPEYKTEGAAGLDLSADLFGRTSSTELPLFTDEHGLYLNILPGTVVMVPTGLSMVIPKGQEGQVRPRSGLTLKKQLTVANAPGTIDSDYRGEVRVLIHNFSSEAKQIRHKDRIAQLVIGLAPQIDIKEVDTLPDTKRGSGGFGSTGV